MKNEFNSLSIIDCGTVHSGKSLLRTQMYIKFIRRYRRKVKFHNFLHPFNKWEYPKLILNNNDIF